MAVFADAASRARQDGEAPDPSDAGSAHELTSPAPAVSTARSSDRLTPRKAPGKRSPARKPSLTLASNVSGDYAITAPPGTPKPPADRKGDSELPAENTGTDAVTVSGNGSLPPLPPLPSLSAEDAALKFEAMPEAPEQRSVLESHEPTRFVWSRRWPFLTVIPASQASTPSVPSRAQDWEPEPVEERAVLLPSASAFDQAEHAEASAGSEEDAQTVLTSRAGVGVAALDQTHPVSADAPASDAIAGEPADRETQRLPAEPAARDEQPAQNVQTSKPDDTDVTATELLTVENEPEPDARGAVVLDVSSGQTPVVDHPASAETAVGDITDAARDVDATPVAEIPDETEAAAATDVAPTEGPNVDAATTPVVLRITGLSRRFGDTVAVDGIDLDVHKGSFYGIVGPNGAGKTTTLSMVTGLLRPDAGNITVHGVDVWKEPDVAKRSIGVLPDRLRLFDRLTGAQLLYYSGVLRGLDGATVRARTRDLARAFGLEDALNRLVTDYSAGMTKKVALAAAMIHSPRLLVLDEPFESVDPVSAANVIEILQKYVAHGGTVVLSSHGMDLIQRVCDHVAIIVHGTVLAAGAVDDVRGSGTLEERFVELAGGRKAAEGMEWLHSFSD